MAAIVIDLKVKVKLSECEYPNKEVARFVEKLVNLGIENIDFNGADLGDSVHEELLDALQGVEVKA